MGNGTLKVPGPGNRNFSGGIGTGIGKIWYRKKYRYRYRLKFWVPSHTDVRTMYIVHTLHYIEDWGGMCDHVLMMLGVAGGSGPVSTGSNIIICI